MNNTSLKVREAGAVTIFETGSCKIDTKVGFKLALHQDLPDAPLSPFYFNLRGMGIKGGVLSPLQIALMSQSMLLLGDKHDLFASGTPVCSIPAAGDPFLDAMMIAIMEDEHPDDYPHRVRLIKDESTGPRRFELAETSLGAWRDTTLVDDLVTSMLTKQLAIDVIRKAGGSVKNLLVFLDRSEDAKTELAKQGITLHAVWEFEALMEWALGRGYINRTQYEIIVEYPARLTAYKRSVGYKG